MLVLSRRCAAEIYIGPDITIKVLEIHKRQVKLGIKAPSGFSDWRGELLPIPDCGEPSAERDFCRSQQASGLPPGNGRLRCPR
jgi:carbon storage regulator CsrA